MLMLTFWNGLSKVLVRILLSVLQTVLVLFRKQNSSFNASFMP